MVIEGLVLALSSMGLAQALFLSFYFFTLQKGNRKAHLFLAGILLGLTIRIGKSVVHSYIDLLPWQRNLGLSGIFIVGPFLLFYGQALLEKQKSLFTKEYLHFIPFFIFILLGFVVSPESFLASHSFGYGIVIVHLGIYLFLAWIYYFSMNTKANLSLLRWYAYIVWGISLIWLFYFAIYIQLIPFYLGGAIFYSFLIYAFTYLLLKRHVFALEKYSNSTMDRKASLQLFQEVIALFKNEEIYTQSNLSLQLVAQHLSVSPRELSQVINENETKNFSEFVNQFRVDKAKQLLIHPNYMHDKIATIAYECGFGNITSFNLAFKAETKLTPSQYRKQFKPS